MTGQLRFGRRQPRPAPSKRIAFVSDAVYPFNKGGKEKRLHEITRRLVRADREVHIYTMQWWDGPKTIVREGVQLHGIMKLRPLYAGGRRSVSQAVMFSLACLQLLWQRFDVADVDSMPVFPVFTLRLVCWLRGKQLFATWHEVWGADYWQTYLPRGGKLAAGIERLAMHLPDVIISNSEHTTRLLQEAGVRQTVLTVPLGVDIEAIDLVPPHPTASDVLYSGRLLSHKNVDVLVRAIAILRRKKPDIRCIIIGDGPEREQIEQLINELRLGDNITLMHFLENHNDLYALMKSSKLFVLPSVREGFGLMVIEANACGLPVITTNHQHNAARDLIIEGQNGLTAEPEPKQLAERMGAILFGPALQPLETLRTNFSRYTWQHAAESIERLLA